MMSGISVGGAGPLATPVLVALFVLICVFFLVTNTLEMCPIWSDKPNNKMFDDKPEPSVTTGRCRPTNLLCRVWHISK